MRVTTLVAAALMLAGTAMIAPSAASAAGPPQPAAGTHLMMDAASAPPLSTMATWQQKSPYAAIGVYIPVSSSTDNRYDKTQANLTSTWVSDVRAGGWNVLPIYVGRQAPDKCTSRTFKYVSGNVATAEAQGKAAAADAAGSAKSLGLSAGAPIVYDMEAYTAGCKSKAIRSFFDGWTTQLHALGRMSGIYGSRASTIADVAKLPTHNQASPDVVWVATASGQAQTASLPPLPNGTWSGKRLNQFNLGVTRTYGGKTINVDESAVDDYVWDTVPPVVSLPSIAPAVSKKKTTVAWSGSDAGAGIRGYDIRTREGSFGKKLGKWSDAKSVSGSSHKAKLKPGEQWCVEVRATDRAGNTSAWTHSDCTTRYGDDRRLSTSGKGWHRKHVQSAFQHTTTVGKHKGSTLSTGTVKARSIGVVFHGTGTVNVLLGHHKIGTATGSGLVWLHLPQVAHGKVRLKTVSHKAVAIDGLALSRH